MASRALFRGARAVRSSLPFARTFSTAAAAAAEPENPLPKKWLSVLPTNAVTYESDVPVSVWEVGARNYTMYHHLTRVAEIMSDPDTASSTESRTRITDLLAPFDPTLASRPLVDLQREMGRLENSVTIVTGMCEVRAELRDALAMRDEARDELKTAQASADEESVASWTSLIAQSESDAADAGARLRDMEQVLLEEVLPKDVDDERSAILEVRAGTGGDEAALFAREVFHMYEAFAQQSRWKWQVIDITKNELNGYREAVASLQGTGVFGQLKFETGVHRVQRIPVTEQMGRVHTSTATVAVLPEVKDVDIDIRECDIRVDLFRARGAGGQHVNTTDSAVRLTHIPTNTVVQCQDERSQKRNKDSAMAVLRSRIYADQREKQHREHAALKQKQIGTGDRSERIRTFNYPQSRVTDHRINYSYHSVDDFLSGDGLAEVIDKLRHQDRLDRMSNTLGPAPEPAAKTKK